MKKFLALAVMLIAATFAFAQPARDSINIEFIMHENANSGFWAVVFNGAQQACDDLGVNCNIDGPPTYDPPLHAQMIESAIANEPDALVISLPDVAALGPAIETAVQLGIPVFSVNSGSDDFQDLGIIRHVGQTEYEAGLGAGKRFKALGGTNGICINHQVGNVALDLRCQGFADGFENPVEVVVTASADPSDVLSAVSSHLDNNADVDTILGAGPQASEPTLQHLEDIGKAGDMLMGSFDLSQILLDGIANGTVHFAIDQQQYLQGYLGIVTAALYTQTGLLTGNEVVLTGPGFVDAGNIEQVRALAGTIR